MECCARSWWRDACRGTRLESAGHLAIDTCCVQVLQGTPRFGILFSSSDMLFMSKGLPPSSNLIMKCVFNFTALALDLDCSVAAICCSGGSFAQLAQDVPGRILIQIAQPVARHRPLRTSGTVVQLLFDTYSQKSVRSHDILALRPYTQFCVIEHSVRMALRIDSETTFLLDMPRM